MGFITRVTRGVCDRGHPFFWGYQVSSMLLRSLSSELSPGGGYTGDFGWYSWTVGCPLLWSGGEVGEVLSWSSSSSQLISKGASWVVKGVASLALFLGFGLHSSSSSFLILLSCTCLEKGERQGPDMRPSALGLYFLVGLGDQLCLPVCPCLLVVLLRLIPLHVFCCANLLSLSLVTLLGVWYLFQGFLQVDEVQGSKVTAEWPLGVLTYTSESTVSSGIRTVMRTSPLHVLLQVADTSGPWMAGGVVR